jgi:hypothetical protein
MWAIGCVMIEMAVWITGGKLALNAFRLERMEETKALIQHERLGRSDCFHDGDYVLNSVKGVVQSIDKNRRQYDDITPAMVDLALTYVLIAKSERLQADKLIPKIDQVLRQGLCSYSSTNDSIPKQISRPTALLGHCNLRSLSQYQPRFSSISQWSSAIRKLTQSSASEMFASTSALLHLPSPEPSDSNQSNISITGFHIIPGPFAVLQSEVTQEAPNRFILVDELEEWIDGNKIRVKELRGRLKTTILLDGDDIVSDNQNNTVWQTGKLTSAARRSWPTVSSTPKQMREG